MSDQEIRNTIRAFHGGECAWARVEGIIRRHGFPLNSETFNRFGLKPLAVEYDSNNSGGSWWLGDDDWRKLAQAGWEVKWCKDQGHRYGERFLGALATSAVRYGLTLEEAVNEWEDITGQYASAEGCSCCGQPHSFWERGGGRDRWY